MTIQVNTDKNIQGGERLAAYVQNMVESELERLAKHITRVEVHLADENGSKSGVNDKRCTLEARIQNHSPTSVTHHADTVELALTGGLDKLKSSLDHTLDKMRG